MILYKAYQEGGNRRSKDLVYFASSLKSAFMWGNSIFKFKHFKINAHDVPDNAQAVYSDKTDFFSVSETTGRGFSGFWLGGGYGISDINSQPLSTIPDIGIYGQVVVYSPSNIDKWFLETVAVVEEGMVFITAKNIW